MGSAFVLDANANLPYDTPQKLETRTMITTRIFATLLALTTLGTLAAQVEAVSYHHLDELALRMQQQSRTLAREFAEHYRHSPVYSHLRSDANSLARLATHVHDLAHRHGSISHLKRDLDRIDSRFHHLESVVAQLESLANIGIGHTHGDVSHVWSALHGLESTIHHMRDDVTALARNCYNRRGHNNHGHNNHGHNNHGRHNHGRHNHGRHVGHQPGSAVDIPFGRGGGIRYDGNRWSFYVGR
jgi:hypothetical protein